MSVFVKTSLCWWVLAVSETLDNTDEVPNCPCLLVAMFKAPYLFGGTVEPVNRLNQSIQSWQHQGVLSHQSQHRNQNFGIQLTILNRFVNITIRFNFLHGIPLLEQVLVVPHCVSDFWGVIPQLAQTRQIIFPNSFPWGRHWWGVGGARTGRARLWLSGMPFFDHRGLVDPQVRRSPEVPTGAQGLEAASPAQEPNALRHSETMCHRRDHQSYMKMK